MTARVAYYRPPNRWDGFWIVLALLVALAVLATLGSNAH